MTSSNEQLFFLEITHPNGETSQYPLDASLKSITMGRVADATLQLDNYDVSRKHAEMQVDDLGRWSVRDLGSRNGTFVNGHRLPPYGDANQWRKLEVGDTFRICGFALTMARAEVEVALPSIDESPGQAAPMSEEDGGPAGPISTLHSVQETKVDPAQLTAIGNFGMRLLKIVRPIKRINSLLDFVVSDAFQGQAAMALRLSKEHPTDPPEVLGAPIYSRLWPEGKDAYVSRSVMRSVIFHNEPILASTQGGADGAIGMTIMQDTEDTAVLCCPLRGNSKMLDALYVIVTPEYGTLDWLAVMSLVAKQYEIAEFAWAMRLAAAKEADPESSNASSKPGFSSKDMKPAPAKKVPQF